MSIPVTMPSLFPKDDAILVRELNLPEDQRILTYYNCCIFPQQWQLVQGSMYITQRFVCFRGWPDTSHKKLIPMETIDHIEKENTAVVIPNAIRVYMNNGHDILFGSFIERDPCYNMLAASIEAEKHYSLIKAEADDRTACIDTATQKLSALQSPPDRASSCVSESVSTSDENGEKDKNDQDVNVERERSRTVSCVDGDPGAMELHLGDVSSSEDLVSLESSSPRKSSSTDDASVTRESPVPQLISFDPIYNRNREITLLHKEALEVPVATVWGEYWREGEGYASFLRNMGDFDISIDEWASPRTMALLFPVQRISRRCASWLNVRANISTREPACLCLGRRMPLLSKFNIYSYRVRLFLIYSRPSSLARKKLRQRHQPR